MRNVLREQYTPHESDRDRRDDDRHVAARGGPASADRREQQDRERKWRSYHRGAKSPTTHIFLVARHAGDLVIDARRKSVDPTREGTDIEKYVRRCRRTGQWFAHDVESETGESEVSREWVASWFLRLGYNGLYGMLLAGRI